MQKIVVALLILFLSGCSNNNAPNEDTNRVYHHYQAKIYSLVTNVEQDKDLYPDDLHVRSNLMLLDFSPSEPDFKTYIESFITSDPNPSRNVIISDRTRVFRMQGDTTKISVVYEELLKHTDATADLWVSVHPKNKNLVEAFEVTILD
ncbi:hypothetical protein ACFFSY_12485 [Paenibacillus aurantiacus]|uniref:Uncharacterized protein n=1 Tax=Paenibacillus aurantiacus TaxID=1936118 RepID=A0ABV5KNH5_9BACL